MKKSLSFHAGARSRFFHLPTAVGVLLLLAWVPLQAANPDLYTSSFTNSLFRIDSAGVATSFSSSIDRPFGLAFGIDGELYVSSDATSGPYAIYKIDPDGTVHTFVNSGLNRPFGIVFDPTGNLFVANEGGGTISKITPQGVVTTFATGLNIPIGLTRDNAGNLYAATSGTVTKIDPLGNLSTYATVPSFFAWGLAFNSAGDLFVSDGATNGTGSVARITPLGAVSTFASGFNQPEGLTFDAADNLYVANSVDNRVQVVSPGGSVSLYSNVSSPTNVAFVPSPEPSTCVMIGLALPALLIFRRHRRAGNVPW